MQIVGKSRSRVQEQENSRGVQYNVYRSVAVQECAKGLQFMLAVEEYIREVQYRSRVEESSRGVEQRSIVVR